MPDSNDAGLEAEQRLLSRRGRRFFAGRGLFLDDKPASEAFLLQKGPVPPIKRADVCERLGVVRPADLLEGALVDGAQWQQRGPGPRWSQGLMRVAWLTLLAFALTACSSSTPTGPGAHNPASMSESEYDIARDLWLRRNQAREALAHALKAVELDDGNAEAAHLVALLYLDFCARGPAECHLRDAEKHARLAIADRSDFREAKNTLAVVLIHEQRYADAIALLKPLTEDILYQTPENAWGNLGWAYLEQGAFDLAIDALKRSVAAQPVFCVGSYRLGLAFEHKRELTSAVDAFTRALETEAPGCNSMQEAFAGRARVQLRLGNSDSARADLDQCAALSTKTEAGKECSAMLQKFK